MGFRFRKRVRILPGVSLNIGNQGINSVSIGGHGVTTNINKRGVKNTYSIPGSGLSYQTTRSGSGQQQQQSCEVSNAVWKIFGIIFGVICIVCANHHW